VSKPESHFCPIFYRNVTKEECQEESQQLSQNREYCLVKKCESLWRFCVVCLMQGYKGEGSLVTDVERHFCDYHFERTPASNRNGEMWNFSDGGDDVDEKPSSDVFQESLESLLEEISTVENRKISKNGQKKSKKNWLSQIDDDMTKLDSLRSLLKTKNTDL
jgi:hypothetical protein